MNSSTTNIPDGSDPAELANWLFDLARQGDAARVAAYIDAGAPVDMRNANGDTMLMLAAYNDHPELVTVLLERGADPNATNDRGQSILAGAIFKQANDVARLLIQAGADPDHGKINARATAAMFGVELPEV